MRSLATRRGMLAALVMGTKAGPLLAAGRVAELQLGDRGPAPEFTGISAWLQSPPLSMAGLRGKVVLVNFWTHTCIYWVRTSPYLNKWNEAYRDQGLVIVGIHTPEFSFEHQKEGVEAAIKRFGIAYPVAQDNGYATWRAWQNHYWPAQMLVDRSGRIMLEHFGEGSYAGLEGAICRLTGAPGPVASGPDPDRSGIGSPEMYFGLGHLSNLAGAGTPRAGRYAFSLPTTLPNNRFGLGGTWALADECATLSDGVGEISLRFRAAKVHMVAGSDAPVVVSVMVDGKAQPSVTIHWSQLYTVFDGNAAGEHVLRLTIPTAGLRAYAFTFG
jgi:thiol-disulfide isomerase/thioredoxin